MEKKGEILNQLAIIADLVEKANIEPENQSVRFVLTEPEFNRIFDIIVKKTKTVSPEMFQDTFSVKIGVVDFIFSLKKPSKNNV